MAIESKIQWTEGTWNPWHGCKKVSTGCKYCYMYRDKERWGQDPTTVLRSKSNFKVPLSWKEGRLIFTCSWSDWFIEEADEWRDEAWAIIKATPQHTYQILTKRPERIKDHLPADWGEGYPNVWLGVSVENQVEAVKRIPELIKTPAKVRFLSCEPLLDFVDLSGWLVKPDEVLRNPIHWVIIGGESGSLSPTAKYKARECFVIWIHRIIKQCQKAKVPVFVKQLGTYMAKEYQLLDRHGGDITRWPQLLQIREMPLIYQNKSK